MIYLFQQLFDIWKTKIYLCGIYVFDNLQTQNPQRSMAIQPETCFKIPQQSVASGDAKETTSRSSPNDVAVKILIKSSIGVIHDAVRMIRLL